LDDVYILATDLEINNILNIENILKPIINQNKKLLIIGDCSQNVINTLGMNVVKNNLKLCNIKPPQFGYKTKELMGDIALSVGAKYFSEATGDDLSLITMADLGHAQKVVVSPTQTVIVRDDERSSEVYERINELKEARDRAQNKSDRDFINDRIASLSGGVGVVYVGGDSDIEQKELYDRVEDAVCAVRSALEEGILPGGGSALLYLSEQIGGSAAEDIISYAMKAPFRQIVENAGKMYPATAGDFGEGWDVKGDLYGDMYKMGVIDPAKVTKNALKNAVSVATTILTTNAIVTLRR
jgi:chaperonin GroEL